MLMCTMFILDTVHSAEVQSQLCDLSSAYMSIDGYTTWLVCLPIKRLSFVLQHFYVKQVMLLVLYCNSNLNSGCCYL